MVEAEIKRAIRLTAINKNLLIDYYYNSQYQLIIKYLKSFFLIFKYCLKNYRLKFSDNIDS